MLNIIVLTHNNLDSTKRCLENIYNYTNKFNIFVLDNASTDETIPYLQEQKKNQNLSFFLSDKNIGIILGRNKAYSLAKETYPGTHYAIFLDNDQYVQKGWQENYLEWTEKGYDIIGCEAWCMKKENFYPYKKIINKDEEFNYCGCGGMMVKDSMVEQIGLFDERYEKYYFEDPDLCWTAHNAGYKIKWVYEAKVEHQKHNLSLSGERKKYFLENWKKFRAKWEGYKMPSFKLLIH